MQQESFEMIGGGLTILVIGLLVTGVTGTDTIILIV